MFMNRISLAFHRWFGSLARGDGDASRSLPVGDRGQTLAIMPVLLASGRDDDYQALQAIFHNTKWSMVRALSWNEVSSFCERMVNPVVLIDRHFQSSNWRSTVSSLLNPPANRSLILLSDVSDPYLWNELVQHGGFDVIARPFERSEVLRTLAFAQRHYESGWPSLHTPRKHRAWSAGRSK